MVEWNFNQATGTMEPVNKPAVGVGEVSKKGVLSRVRGAGGVPLVKEGHSLANDVPVSKPSVSTNERDVVFREKSDLVVLQITDYDSNRVMGYIAGYGLDINFNMEELDSVERVEQFLDGLKKAFRSIILNKALGQ